LTGKLISRRGLYLL